MNTFILVLVSLFSLVAFAQDVQVQVSPRPIDTTESSETTITVRKGTPHAQPSQAPSTPDFQIIESSDEISGDPAASTDASLESWKAACAEWKKELKEANGKRLISSNCGRPQVESDPKTFRRTHSSFGKYKVRLSNRDADNHPQATP